MAALSNCLARHMMDGYVMKQLLSRIVLMLVGIAIAIFVTEAAVRLTGPKKDPGIAPQFYFVPDDVTGIDIAKNFPAFTSQLEGVKIEEWSNNIGCFDRDYRNEKNPIILVGDSFTWGFAPFEDKWGTLIEKYVGKRVLKCGVNGYGAAQELEKAKKVVTQTGEKPSLILVGYYYNDLANDWLFPNSAIAGGWIVQRKILEDLETGRVKALSDAELQERADNFRKYCHPFVPQNELGAQGMCLLKKYSALYPFIKEAGKNLLFKIGGLEAYRRLALANNPFENETEYLDMIPVNKFPWLETAWQKHFDNLIALQAFARSVNAELLLALIPNKLVVYPELQKPVKDGIPYLDFGQEPGIVTEFLDRAGIQYIDLLPEFTSRASENLYWKYDGHWNIKGNHLAGLLVSRWLLENNLVQMPPEAKANALREVSNALEAF